MRVAVLYESLMGNTRQIGEAIADGLRQAVPGAEVTCGPVGAGGQVAADLLIVGAPTHFFGLPRPRTRGMWVKGQHDAQRRGQPAVDLEPDAAGPGVREWLDALPPASGRQSVALFDTRLDKPMSGGAAPRIARRLQRLGYTLAVAPQGFFVAGMAGPVRPSELARARAWEQNWPRTKAPRLPIERAHRHRAAMVGTPSDGAGGA